MTTVATIDTAASAFPDTSAEWIRRLRPYRLPVASRAWFELLVTLGPFFAGWIAMVMAWQGGHMVLYALLLLPTAGFLVRLFMIQHDCGHGSFLPGRSANDWTGRILGVLTHTPYEYWRRSHAVHHAGAGNLDARGIGDIDTLSVDEYRACGRWQRLRYRTYRHPIAMFGIGPAYLFLVQHRYPCGFTRKGPGPWISTMGTNLAMLVLVGAAIALVGPTAFLVVQLPVALVAATIGVWLFYIQHQFEETYWAHSRDWTPLEAALHGSSHYDLPPVLRWFSANIGVHHVHHLASRIPFYRLPAVLRDHPELAEVNRLTLRESFRCVRLTLWDESGQRLVSFADLPALEVAARSREAAATQSG